MNSNNVRFDYPSDFSFSRASSGYNAKGKLFTPNQLRLESSIYGGAMALVEESSTNLLTANQASVETDTTGFSSNNSATISRTTDEAKFGNASLKVVTPGSVTYEGVWTTASSVSASTTYTASVYVKGSGTINFALYQYDSSGTKVAYPQISITLSDTWTRYSITASLGSTVTMVKLLVCTSSVQAITFYADGFKLEAKSYPTSFCIGTRSAETLTMPTTNLSVSEGTVEAIVEVTDVSNRQISGQAVPVIAIYDGSYLGVRIAHRGSAAQFALQSSTSTSAYSSVYFDEVEAGFYYVKMYWTTSLLKCEFWNLVTQTLTVSASIDTPNLPTSFSYLQVGYTSYEGTYANTRFGTHRLSSTARTDDPDFDDLMPRDDNTLYLVDFDDIKFRTIKNMVL